MRRLVTSEIAERIDPFRDHPWGHEVTRQQVLQALADSRLEPRHGTENHAERITYFVANRCDDPVHVDVGVPGLGQGGRFLTDGHHRLAAAIIRGDQYIPVEISGSLDEAEQLMAHEWETPDQP